MINNENFRLGDLLVKQGLITREQLDKALEMQKTTENQRIGEVLIKLGLVTEQDVVIALGKQLNMPYASYSKGLLVPALDQNLDKLLTEEFCRKHCIIPLSVSKKFLSVAVADPLDVIMLDNLRRITGFEIKPIIATVSDIEKAIDAFYGEKDLLRDMISKSYDEEKTPFDDLSVKRENIETLDIMIAKAEEAPVVRLVDLILKQAIKDRASDIHIEPFKDKITIRSRIDGVLYEIPPPAKHMLLPLISRIKILSKLDIAEKRLPQDGSFSVKIENRTVDLRVSTIPTIYGEKVVMRILDRESVPLNIAQLGFSPEELELFKQTIKSPYGLIFLTGPTGSGKTTSLYAALNEIRSPKKNLITIEDPVEYELEGINQVQVRPQIGLTFASGLRSFLRQDPDVIMVGEVRDLDTAEICIRAALTGHLVFSTLHTNDAAQAVTRLIDMGISPFLLIGSLTMVVAQRLVRKLCPECREGYELAQKNIIEDITIKQELIYKAKGCEACRHTGYSGRVALYELMNVTDKIKQMISKNCTAVEIKQIAKENGMKTLLESGIEKVEEGVTSLEEVLRVVIGG